MSTYIFYLGIGNFDQSSIRDKNVEFRIFARPGNAVKGKYALENAVKFLRAYEEYYGINYPLDKLRPHRFARICLGRDGELGGDNFSRNSSPDRRK